MKNFCIVKDYLIIIKYKKRAISLTGKVPNCQLGLFQFESEMARGFIDLCKYSIL